MGLMVFLKGVAVLMMPGIELGKQRLASKATGTQLTLHQLQGRGTDYEIIILPQNNSQLQAHHGGSLTWDCTLPLRGSCLPYFLPPKCKLHSLVLSCLPRRCLPRVGLHGFVWMGGSPAPPLSCLPISTIEVPSEASGFFASDD